MTIAENRVPASDEPDLTLRRRALARRVMLAEAMRHCAKRPFDRTTERFLPVAGCPWGKPLQADRG